MWNVKPTREGGVLLHVRPGCCTNLRIAVPEPEVVVDPVEVETGCTLVYREIDTEEDCFTAEDPIAIEYVSNMGYGIWLEDRLQRGYGRSEHPFAGGTVIERERSLQPLLHESDPKFWHAEETEDSRDRVVRH